MSLARSLFRWILGKRLPVTQGRLETPGIDADVEIRRDRWGVPHITASNDADAWFGLGFCHGQDRSFQLESLLRLARGTLAELVGPEVLPIDRLSRRIGFHVAARAAIAVQSPQRVSVVDAYVRGVNAGRTTGSSRKAHEFALLRSEPTAYALIDAASIPLILSFLLASNWDAEITRWKILVEDGAEAVRALDPSPYHSDFTVTSPPGSEAGPVVDRLAEDLSVLARHFPAGGASNNWVLAGTRTRSGRPIVASDPHLPPSLPSPWYLAHISTPDWSAAGATFVGGPGFSVGHNGHGAWGPTSGFIDNTDFFIEEVGEDGRSVRGPNGFDPCPVREERIDVKGADTVIETVLQTPRGPIVSPAFEGERHALSLRATWLDPLPLAGMLDIHQARSFDEFRECFRDWPVLPLSYVWAEQSGRIGWQLAGAAPRRRSGRGTIPLPGWLPDSGWEEEMVPFEEMPFLDSPRSGYVATANNAPRAPDEEPFLGADFLDSYRQRRIAEAIEARSDWDLAGTLELQMDVACVPWREIRDAVLDACSAREDLKVPYRILADWDGELGVRSSAASLFECLVAVLCRRLAETAAPRSFEHALGRGAHPIMLRTHFVTRRAGHLVRAMSGEPPQEIGGSWGEIIASSLLEGHRQLVARFGANPTRWEWGRIRGVRFRHPFGQIKILASIFDRGPFPMGGDANTVAQSAVDALDPLADALFIPSLRMVVDVGNWEDSRFVIPGGQSGIPLSPHYDDQLDFWLRGEGIPMPFSREAVQEASCETLILSTPRGIEGTG